MTRPLLGVSRIVSRAICSLCNQAIHGECWSWVTEEAGEIVAGGYVGGCCRYRIDAARDRAGWVRR